jgi:hypothetical protein
MELLIALETKEGPHVIYITSSRLYLSERLPTMKGIVRLSESLRAIPIIVY